MPKIRFNNSVYICTFFLFFLSLCNAQTLTGKYTGDGNSTQSISGLGAQPDVLLVIPSTGGSASGEIQTWLHSSTMGSDEVKFTTGGDLVANGFKTGYLSSIDSDGFTVDSKSNVLGTEYYYVAFSDNDGSITTGTFTGSTSTQNIATGYEPAMVWVWADNVSSPDYVKWTTSSNPTWTNRFSHGCSWWGEDIFNGFSPIGFTVTSSTSSGSGVISGGVYHYVSFQGTLGTATPGWGSGPDKITTSVQPGFLMTRHNSIRGNSTFIRTHEMPSGESYIPDHRAAQTNGILDFYVDGYDVGNTGQLRNQHSYFVTEYITTLPVEFVRFQGKEIEGDTYLNWTTGSEINNDYFEIQASYDGQNWEVLRVVDGAGNSMVKLDYVENLGKDTHTYYRLKQVDFNGSFDFSNVIYISKNNTDGTNNLKLFPNPVENQLNILSENSLETNYNAEVVAIDGSVVKSEKSINFANGNMVSIDFNDLAKGVYTIMVSDGDRLISAQRVIKK